MMTKLSRAQKKALKIMIEDGGDIVYSYGCAYVGDERTNMKLIQSLLRMGLISVADFANFDHIERYVVNSTGRGAYKNGYANQRIFM